MHTQTFMRREINEIPEATRKLLSDGRDKFINAARKLESFDPQFLITVARGSSDHAATYLKYTCEIEMGIPVASTGPSISSIWGTQMRAGSSASIAISQSGKSPDIVSLASSLRSSGALSIAVTNETTSPLAAVSDSVIDINAGNEKSVAATKTFVTSAVASLSLLAHWKKDDALITAIDQLPERFAEALTYDWPELRSELLTRKSLFVLGRGPSLAMSHEAALKFKETCQIHAESYSSAEVLHGPVSVVEEGYPILALTARDAAEESITSVSDQLASRGASVFITSDNANIARKLDFAETGHPLTDPLAMIVSFYSFIEKLAADMGKNPDHPRNLRKVTETV